MNIFKIVFLCMYSIQYLCEDWLVWKKTQPCSAFFSLSLRINICGRYSDPPPLVGFCSTRTLFRYLAKSFTLTPHLFIITPPTSPFHPLFRYLAKSFTLTPHLFILTPPTSPFHLHPSTFTPPPYQLHHLPPPNCPHPYFLTPHFLPHLSSPLSTLISSLNHPNSSIINRQSSSIIPHPSPPFP